MGVSQMRNPFPDLNWFCFHSLGLFATSNSVYLQKQPLPEVLTLDNKLKNNTYVLPLFIYITQFPTVSKLCSLRKQLTRKSRDFTIEIGLGSSLSSH